jgi:outer membrane protein assembly factor BamB
VPPRADTVIRTGAEVCDARVIDSDRGPILLVQAGETIAALDRRGSVLWHDQRLPRCRLIYAGRFGASGRPAAIVLVGTRQLLVLDAVSGRRLWRWSAPVESFLSADCVRLVGEPSRPRLLCFPVYTTSGHCFDLTDVEKVHTVWSVSYGRRWDRGFGPNVIALADPAGGLFLSSRSGSAYGVDPATGRTTTAEVVQGRRDGRIYQAWLDASTGLIRSEISWRPDGDGYPYARPYGLLTSYDDGAATVVVLVSCQVEEFVAVSEVRGDEVRPLWARFIERDWPDDVQELRPQTTSLADVDGDGRPELVVGHWDGRSWRTLVLDPRVGFDQPKALIDGEYFWGSFGGSILTSPERTRLPTCEGGLIMRSSSGSRTMVAGTPVVTDRDPLPAGIGFMAGRQSVVAAADGFLLRDRGSVALVRGAERSVIAGPDVCGIFGIWPTPAIVDEMHQIGVLGELWRVPLDGRSPVVLPWNIGGKLELVVGLPDGCVASFDARSGERLWDVRGRLAATTRGAALVVAEERSPGEDDVVVYVRGDDGLRESWRAPLGGHADLALAPFGSPLRVVAAVREGVHTSRLAIVAEDRRIDIEGGAHPCPPAVWTRANEELILADDHGVLRALGADGTVLFEHDWYAAYSTPIPVEDRDAILRANSTHGFLLLDADGRVVWQQNTGLLRTFPGRTVLLHEGASTAAFASAGADGWISMRDIETGEVLLRRRAPGGLPAALAARDVDGDGREEVIVGGADGRLRCLDTSTFDDRWSIPLGAAITDVMAPEDGPLIVATADGAVRVAYGNADSGAA